MATTSIHERVLIGNRESTQASAVLSQLEHDEGVLAAGRDDDLSHLPPELGRILQQIIAAMATGRTITIGSVPEELTTSTAADLLGISRPTLMKKVAAGEIPAHRVGTHTRLRASDVSDYIRARRARQRAAFEELLAVEDDES